MTLNKDYIWGDATEMECGCIFEKTDIGYIMHWCPLHKATPLMYEALKELLDALGNPMEIPPYEVVEKASKVLSDIEGG